MIEKSPSYNKLFDIIPLPSWIYNNENFRILDVNETAIQHYGYSREEFLSLTIKELRPKEHIPNLLRAHANSLNKEGNIQFGVFTHQKKDGTLIRMKINGQKVKFEEQKCVLVICEDITEEEDRLNQLKIAEARLSAATAIAKLGYWRLDLETNVLTWTDEIFKIWGRNKEDFEVNYQNFFESIHPQDKETFETERKAAFAGKNDLDHIHRIILPDDSIKWVHELGRIIKDENGKQIAFEGTVQDISAQKMEEQRLKLFESVILNTKDAVLITEAEPFDEPGHRILYVNEAFTKMTGYSAEEVIGKTPRILQGPSSDKAELTRLGKSLRNWESCEVNMVNYKKNGEEFWINFSVSPVANEKGWFTHWIAIERDVTEQKLAALQQDLLSKISLDFSFENDLLVASKNLCKTVCEFGKFDLVEVWTVNLEKSKLHLYTHFVPETENEIFYELSSQIKSLQITEGLPGKVWANGTQLLMDDVHNNNEFLRCLAAEKIELKAVLGIPLFFSDEVIGVMVIGSKKDHHHVNKYAHIFNKLEHFIGSEINRKKLENDLNHLYEAVPDILCTTDFNGRLLKMNKAGCALLNYCDDEMLHHLLEEFVYKEDARFINNQLMKLCNGEKNVAFENRCLTKLGETVWLSWSCNADHKERLVYATAKNITEEKKLKELNLQANSLAKIGSWEIDLINEKVYWSDLVHELHETDPNIFVPDVATGINFYKEDFRELVQKNVEICMQTGAPFDFEAIVITKNNNERWVRVLGDGEMIDGNCKRIYGSFQDIHAKKTMELQIQEILGSISDAFYAVDKKWNFTYFNKEAENLLLKNVQDVLGKNIWEEFPAAKNTLLEEVYYNVVETGKATTIDYFFPGDNNWYEVNAYPSQGGISAYFKNITERKNATELLNKSYEEKNTILESIGDAFFSVTNEWIVTYWNKEAENILGKKREEVLGINLWESFPDAIDSTFHHEYQKALDTKEIVNFESYYSTLNIWFEVSVYPSANGLSIYFKDITLRKQADIKLVQANERFEKVTKATNDVIWDWDLTNKTFYRSDGIEKIFGSHASKSFTEKNFWNDSFHPEYLPNIIESIQNAIKDPLCHRWEMEYVVLNQEGKHVYIVDRGLITRDNQGKAIRMVGAMTDITERKNHENQLLDLNTSIKQYAHELEISNEELEQFAFIASHDLQEPLRMISSFLDQLKRKYAPQLDEKAQQYIHFATDGAKRMKQIILDLLEYSRAGKLTDTIEEVNLNEVLEQYRWLRSKIISEKNVVIIASSLPTLTTFKAPITQTIHCLLDNAIKYCAQDQIPNIEIAAEIKDNMWLFQVKDNGIGIDPKFYDKIFIMFQRLHNRDQFAGNGIGLPIAKKHVESWGGKIWLHSIPEKGSIFYFTHPKK